MYGSSKLSVIRLRTFCFKYTLRSGVIVAIVVIGFYYVVFATMMAFWLLWIAQWKTEKPDEGIAAEESWYIAVALTFVFAGINAVTVIFLLFSISKHRQRLIIPALVFLFFSIVFNLFHLIQKISGLCRPSKVTNPSDASEQFEVIVYDLTLLAFVCYLWAILLSYYMQTTEANNLSAELADALPTVPRPLSRNVIMEDDESPWVSSTSESSKTDKKRDVRGQNERERKISVKKNNRVPVDEESAFRLKGVPANAEPGIKLEKKRKISKVEKKKENKMDDDSPSSRPSSASSSRRQVPGVSRIS